jgi:prepilin-type processing-associated H-X9-DG protein
LTHEESQGHFPTGGSSLSTPKVGDPDLGFGAAQTGGWFFNILPYMEQQTLHDMGAGRNAMAKKPLFAQREQTPLAVMNCPSRRPPLARPFIYPSHQPSNCATLTIAAKVDYACNAGDLLSPEGTTPNTGIVFHQSTIRPADITDGLSNTYLVGDKSLCPDYYESGQSGGDDDTAYFEANCDVLRSTYPGTTSNPLAPAQDQPGVDACYSFGSAHAGAFNMAMCDGSVLAVSYSIDLETHRCLGNRQDGKVIDGSKL